MSTGPIILGVHNGHDASCCLFRNRKISVYIEEERLNKFKHAVNLVQFNSLRDQPDSFFPWNSMEYCLAVEGLGINDVDHIVITNKNKWLPSRIPVADKSKVCFVTDQCHHLLHAYAAFYSFGLKHSAVLVADGQGSIFDAEYESESGYFFDTLNDPEEIFKNTHPLKYAEFMGLGMMYSAISKVLGFFSPKSGAELAGKTMGLAPYGNRSLLFKPFLSVDASSSRLDFSGLEQFLWQNNFIKPYDDWLSVKCFKAKNRFNFFEKSLASHVQKELEKGIVHLARYLSEQTKCKNLCISGGVGLNSVANQKINKNSGFKNVYILPNCNDAGNSMGAIYWLLKEKYPGQSLHLPKDFYFGRDYPNHLATIEQSGLSFERLDTDRLLSEAAMLLASNKVIAWFESGAEAGPRALGNRSILANPSSAWMRDHVNRNVKFRELFRPLAPVVPKDKAKDWFEMDDESPYMLKVFNVRADKQLLIPAVTHIDGSARVQTVSPGTHPRLHRLLHLFENLSGVPVLINTSFNQNGFPIVETPDDAIECLINSEIDYLVVGDYLVRNRCNLNRPFTPCANVISRLQEMKNDLSKEEFITGLCLATDLEKEGLFDSFATFLNESQIKYIKDYENCLGDRSVQETTLNRIFLFFQKAQLIKIIS